MIDEFKVSIPYLKCVKEIPTCPGLEVGDLLFPHPSPREHWMGGYEYAVCRRRDDGMVFKFRIEHLDDCFEVEQVEEGPDEWRANGDDVDGGCGAAASGVFVRTATHKLL